MVFTHNTKLASELYCMITKCYCNSLSNKRHDLKKKTVPQWGVESQPLAIQVSIIPLDYWDTDCCHIHPSKEKASSCVLSSEITLPIKCNSGSNKWHNLKTLNSVPQQGVKPRPLSIRASIIPLDYRDTDLSECYNLWPIMFYVWNNHRALATTTHHT